MLLRETGRHKSGRSFQTSARPTLQLQHRPKPNLDVPDSVISIGPVVRRSWAFVPIRSVPPRPTRREERSLDLEPDPFEATRRAISLPPRWVASRARIDGKRSSVQDRRVKDLGGLTGVDRSLVSFRTFRNGLRGRARDRGRGLIRPTLPSRRTFEESLLSRMASSRSRRFEKPPLREEEPRRVHLGQRVTQSFERTIPFTSGRGAFHPRTGRMGSHE